MSLTEWDTEASINRFDDIQISLAGPGGLDSWLVGVDFAGESAPASTNEASTGGIPVSASTDGVSTECE